jgi:signal transduction histidine kinase
VRLRLTLLYGGVFLASGAVLLCVTYLLVRQTTHGAIYSVKPTPHGAVVRGPHGAITFRAIQFPVPMKGAKGYAKAEPPPEQKSGGTIQILRTRPLGSGDDQGESVTGSAGVPPLSLLPSYAKNAPIAGPLLTIKQAESQARQLQVLASQQHHDELHRLLLDLVIALGIMAIASMGLGWLIAGRALRPLQTITKTARAISASNLHRRLSLRGPNDELRELGNTFDELLGRLERSFEAQRQFVANASHELRTPLTLERAILEVTLANPTASNESLRATCERVLAIGEQQERMIEALLTLARSDRGLERREPFDLEVLAREAVIARQPEIARRELGLESDLRSAWTTGDPLLVERLVANLIDNAVRHNTDGGWLRVATHLDSEHTVIEVSNSGPLVRQDDVERLFMPFQRLGAARSARGEGHGLGLSIVAAIATAHGATIQAEALPEGGLDVKVSFVAFGGARAQIPIGVSAGEQEAEGGGEIDQGSAVAPHDAGPPGGA